MNPEISAKSAWVWFTPACRNGQVQHLVISRGTMSTCVVTPDFWVVLTLWLFHVPFAVSPLQIPARMQWSRSDLLHRPHSGMKSHPIRLWGPL